MKQKPTAPQDLAREDALPLGGLYQAIVSRADSWLNAIIGIGGDRDKTTATHFCARFRVLNLAELTAMFATEHISAKIVDLYPREAMRAGYELGGWEKDEDSKDDLETSVCDFLKPYQIHSTALRASIWGRLYGGAKILLGTMDPSVDLSAPFQLGERVDFLRVIDRRYVDAASFTPDNLDVHGRPIQYQVHNPEGGIAPRVHTSRLIHFPGALTDDQTRQSLAGWDLSVLQRCYDTLAADGELGKSIRLLVSEASIGVMKIKGLFGMIGSGDKERLQNRLQLQAMSMSIARRLVLDAEGESYERVNTSFAGLSDLTSGSMQQIASAAETPQSILYGDAPSGMGDTGTTDLQWWLTRVDAWRRTEALEDPLTRLHQVLLSQEGSPVRDQAERTKLKWCNMWSPTSSERAEIYSKTASADAVYIQNQVATPDEIAKSRFGDDGYSQETEIDRSLRDESQGLDDTGETPPGAPGTPPIAGATADGAAKPADTAMNGAQVTSLVDVVAQVAAKTLPPDSAQAILELAFNLSPEDAKRVIGSAGSTFIVEPPAPPATFGGGGFPPKGPPGEKPAEPGDKPAPAKKESDVAE